MRQQVIWIGAMMASFGCTRTELDEIGPGQGGVPEGCVRVEVDFSVKGALGYSSRAEGDISNWIDNVNLFWFTDTNGNGSIDGDDELTERRYFEYGTRQDIYLKRAQVYFAYAVANLEDAHCPNGNLSTYFDDVQTYAHLQKKYILNNDPPTNERTKIVMAADAVVRLELPGYPDVTDPDQKITPEILLSRVFSQFKIDIYNRVAGEDDRTVKSFVNPVSMIGVDFTRGSYLMPRAEDFSAEATGYSGDTYFQPRSANLVADGSEPIVEYPAGSGRYYTQQRFEIYTFENRKGSVPGITDAYERKDEAPEHSTHLRLSSLISQDAVPTEMRGKVLFTWVHIGKGRSEESPLPDTDVTNYDVDRNCVYHINIVIDGISSVSVDTRRQYLDQMVLFELPNAVNSIDAHYVDMPAYLSGNAQGMVKIQSGTGTLGNDGTVSDWVPMSDTDADEDRWLRFSMYDPQAPNYLISGAPVTWYTPAASTSLYVNMPEGGLSKRRLLLHFNENVKNSKPATFVNGIPQTDNPPSRTALIRIGFVEGVHTKEEYDHATGDVSFYEPVRQYGVKTIGALGGYVSGRGYTALLGVESVEESQVLYYTTSGLVPPPPYDATSQIFWQYRTGTAGNTNQTYDGLAATRALYNDYRGNNVPPQRGQTNFSPATGLYNPFTNTNAADYCMRKNRDENGDGIITGNEVKWYLPTPVQMSQLYQWRGAFQYALNQGYMPLGASTATTNYWTSNESDANQAFISTFGTSVNTTVPQTKSVRSAVRCVRDIEGDIGSGMFYISSDGYLVADLTGHLPNLSNGRLNNQSDNYLRRPENNTITPAFVISRWYTSSNSNNDRRTPPVTVRANDDLCAHYSEDKYPSGSWVFPSERELSIIYTYAEMLNAMLKQRYPDAPLPHGDNDTFHYLKMDAYHWGYTNVGDDSTYWYIDFKTGASSFQKKNSGNTYMRCIRYVTPAEIPTR